MPKPKRRAGVSEYDVASAQASGPFAHPADEIEAGDESPVTERGETAEAFHRLFLSMIPTVADLGAKRQMQAGYNRMCALTYRVGPSEFWPGMTAKDVAEKLGISYQAFKKHLAHVDEYLRTSRGE